MSTSAVGSGDNVGCQAPHSTYRDALGGPEQRRHKDESIPPISIRLLAALAFNADAVNRIRIQIVGREERHRDIPYCADSCQISRGVLYASITQNYILPDLPNR